MTSAPPASTSTTSRSPTTWTWATRPTDMQPTAGGPGRDRGSGAAIFAVDDPRSSKRPENAWDETGRNGRLTPAAGAVPRFDPQSRLTRRHLLSAPARAGKTRVIAIDGRSGAGKSSLADVLRGELEAPVVSLEDLYGGWDGLERGIDLLVCEVLEPLNAGRAALVPRYDWVAQGWDKPWRLDPPEVLIVEGVGAGARRAAAYASVLIWIEEPEPVRKKRALDRDGATYAPYWDMWAAQENALLAREHTPDRADLIVTAAASG